MGSFPNLANSTAFPSFARCPLATPGSEACNPSNFLFGTINENMTLSSTPTFICKDRDLDSFALKISLSHGMKIEDFEHQKFKKGFTVVVKNARRGGVVNGKQGYIETKLEDVQIIPTNLERLMAISSDSSVSGASREESAVCQVCRTINSEGQLLRCKGCESVWYCDKDCQRLGWSEKGHKAECKILKAMNESGLKIEE